MKTIIIYDQCGEKPIEFYVYNGDCCELDGHYINGVDDQTKDERLLSIVENNTKYTSFPEGEMGPDTIVIVAGFLP